jgi:hypothetical protein
MNKFLSILLPHCDDELFVLPFIEKKTSEGYVVCVFYLVEANLQRQKESEELFSQYKAVKIFHLGSLHNIQDGKLSSSLDYIFEILSNYAEIHSCEILMTPMFEGGHIDHDATFQIGYRLGSKLKKDHFAFSTYNAYETPFVRVATVFQKIVTGKIESVRFTFLEGLNYLRQCFRFKSQFVILTFLFPGLVRTFLIKKKIEILKVEDFNPQALHPGRIFYKSALKDKVKGFLKC